MTNLNVQFWILHHSPSSELVNNQNFNRFGKWTCLPNLVILGGEQVVSLEVSGTEVVGV